MTHQALTPAQRMVLSAERRVRALKCWAERDNAERANMAITSRVKMQVSPWFVDEQGNPSRVVRCAE